jgi:hypothetical protein
MLQMGLVSFAAPFPTLVLMESKGTSVRERATAFNAALAMADDRVRTGAERLTADAPDGIGAVGAAGALPSPVWRDGSATSGARIAASGVVSAGSGSSPSRAVERVRLAMPSLLDLAPPAPHSVRKACSSDGYVK